MSAYRKAAERVEDVVEKRITKGQAEMAGPMVAIGFVVGVVSFITFALCLHDAVTKDVRYAAAAIAAGIPFIVSALVIGFAVRALWRYEGQHR